MNLLIVGAGGYGHVAQQVAETVGKYEKISFLDDMNSEAIGKFDDYMKFKDEYQCAFVALGNNNLRREWFDKLRAAGYSLEILVSPMAYVSRTAKLGEGTIVEPMAVVNSASTVGCGTLVCAGAVINHNSIVGDFCHIDCSSVVGVGAVVDDNTKVKYNQIVLKK